MIATSSPVKMLCILVAGALVAGAAVLSFTPSETRIAGAGEAPEAMIGNSFADMAVGTLTAAQPVALAATTPAPQQIQPVATATTAQPPQTQPVVTETPPVQALAALAPALAPIVTPPVAAPASAPVLQTITATEQADAAPQLSSRPKLRDPVLAAKAAPPKPAAKPRSKPRATPRGNANRSAVKGTSNGTKAARATTQGTTNREAETGGSAAASNYPGQVMRRISRVAKPRVNNRGTAVVAFSISGNGGLSQVSISRSSGSSKLDRAALQVIQKAAPFPAPPRGAQRNFSIRIKGR